MVSTATENSKWILVYTKAQEEQKAKRQRPEPLDSYFMGGIASLIK